MSLRRANPVAFLALACFLASTGPVHSAALSEAALGQARDRAEQYLVNRWVPYRSEGYYYEVGHDVQWLRQSIEGAYFIPSFELPDSSPVYCVLTKYKRVFVYDLAVATCALVLAGKHEEAKGLLLTLESVQLPDGALPFSFNTQDTFMNYSYIRTGTVAWAGYAAVLYERETGDPSFRPFASHIADWLLLQIVPGTSDTDCRAGLPLGGYGQWMPNYSSIAKGRREWACTEHSIDAYFFLRLYAETAPDNGGACDRYRDAADRIKNALTKTLWTETEEGSGRFHQGVSKQGLDRGQALDCVGWGALFLLAIGEESKARAALCYADAVFATTFIPGGRPYVGRVRGYRPYVGKSEGVDWDDYPDVVWSEGSLGVALAYLRLGDRQRFRAIVGEILKLCTVPGDPATGVRYSRYRQHLRGKGGDIETTDFIADFTRAPSTCSTAWLLLVLESAKKSNLDKFWGPE